MAEKLCNNCILILLKLLDKEEILLLNALQKNNYINSQMSLDEKGLLELFNSMDKKNQITIYKIRKYIMRLTAVNFISGNKFSSYKFYINENGLRAVRIYQEYVKRQLVTSNSISNNSIPVIEEKEITSTTKRKKK